MSAFSVDKWATRALRPRMRAASAMTHICHCSASVPGARLPGLPNRLAKTHGPPYVLHVTTTTTYLSCSLNGRNCTCPRMFPEPSHPYTGTLPAPRLPGPVPGLALLPHGQRTAGDDRPCLHNGLLLLIAQYRDWIIARGWDVEGHEHMPVLWLVSAAVVTLVGMGLVNLATRRRPRAAT